jgi:ABC-type multidrug transport system permease subunit
MIGFQSNFLLFYMAVYAVAMSSTAMSVFLGCIVEDENTAKELFPILTVPQMLFAGFFVSPDLIPPVIRWAQYLCALTHSVRLLLVIEFDRDCGTDLANANCQAILNNVDAESDDIWKNWIGLLVIFFGYRLLGLFFLQRKGNKFYS